MQTVGNRFRQLVTSPLVPMDWNVSMSMTKEFDEDIQWFTLDESLLDGPDILMPSDDNELQEWFKYEYEHYRDRVTSMEWTREIEFPYSVQSAMADVSLRNTDGYFTPGGTSPISQYILPKRPILLFEGFRTAENLGQFVGITQGMPEVNNTEASFHALDFLSELYSLPINDTIAMRDVYTHEVLEEILLQQGLVPSQFNLPNSRNLIPFLFFERGISTGEAIRQLMQAEGGLFWLDEQGIYRFTPRVVLNRDPVYTLDESTIVDVNVTGESRIINHVEIRSQVREVQAFQSVHSKRSAGDGTDDTWVVPANGTITQNLSLTDPIMNAQEPTLGFASGVSWFTARRADSSNVTSGVEITYSETLTNSYRIEFTNTNPFAVEIDRLDLWAEPAPVIDDNGMLYELQYDDSVERYGLQTLSIDNDFITDAGSANSLALMILDGMSEHRGVIEASVRINPALQLNDIVEVDYREYAGTYRITKIRNVLRTGIEVSQILTLTAYTVRPWFILSSNDDAMSLLDGEDVLTY